jgi:hypothetical protein
MLPQRRYEELTAAVRRYRDMLMHKRAGRGHVLDGIASTGSGKLAIESPVIPHPGKNLPDDWRTRFEHSP